MKSTLPPLALLRTFEVAARHLSFKRAAEELHVTPAAVSLQIRQLEDWLGLALFHRLTRALALSEAGATLLGPVREGLGQLQAGVDALRGPADALTVTAPPSFATHWLLPRLPRFQAAHPGLVLRLAATPDAVDRRGGVPALAGLDAASADAVGHSAVAIVYGLGAYPGTRAEVLLRPDYLPVCAPLLADGRPAPRAPAGLLGHELIHDETLLPLERPDWGWPAWAQAAGLPALDVRRGLRCSNAVLAIEAALAGQGVLLGSLPLVQAALDAGRLVAPFGPALPSPCAYHLVLPEAVAERPVVQALRAWLRAEVEAEAGGRAPT